MAMHFAMSKIIPNICLSTPIFETQLDSRIVLDCKIHGHACIRDICDIYNFQQSRMNKGEGVPFLSS